MASYLYYYYHEEYSLIPILLSLLSCIIFQVRTWKMNLYTVIQFVLVCLLFGLKLSPAGMVYPLAIVCLIPVRSFLSRFIFNHVEMEAVSINICVL